ncbi:hypothetical protein ACWC09_46095 [Streptomyces sp. NPDC001617]
MWKKNFTVDFANATNDGATYSGMQTTLQNALKGTGTRLNVYNNNSLATTIFQNLSTMIAAKPDVIIEVDPKPPAQTFPPQTIVTKDNVDTIFNRDGTVKQFPPLNSASQCLATDGQGIL